MAGGASVPSTAGVQPSHRARLAATAAPPAILFCERYMRSGMLAAGLSQECRFWLSHEMRAKGACNHRAQPNQRAQWRCSALARQCLPPHHDQIVAALDHLCEVAAVALAAAQHAHLPHCKVTVAVQSSLGAATVEANSGGRSAHLDGIPCRMRYRAAQDTMPVCDAMPHGAGAERRTPCARGATVPHTSRAGRAPHA